MRRLLTILYLLVSLMYNQVGASLEIFDVHKVADNAELTNIDVTQPQVDRWSKSQMPDNIFAAFECRGKLMQLKLRHYPYRRVAAGGDNFDPDGIDRNNFQYNLIGDGIPIYTKQKEIAAGKDTTRVVFDSFPRLFAQSCRTYTDYANHASLVGIYDPQFESIKFFGSFFMDGIHFFLQPFSSRNLTDEYQAGDGNVTLTDRRLHVMEEVPRIDFSDDNSVIAKDRTNVGLSDGIRNPSKNPRVFSGPFSKQVKTGPSYRQTRRKRPNAFPNNDEISKIRQGRRRKNRNRFQGFLTKQNSYRHDLSTDFATKQNSSATAEQILRNTFRRRRQNLNGDYTVEVFIVCDFLCYQRFQRYYNITDLVMTKNAIAEFFAYIRTFYQTAYGDLAETYPSLGLSVEIRVVGLYIATDPSDKIIGDYVIGNNNEVDAKPSAFEFALWVEDSLEVSLKADHYALVTGYDLSGQSSGIIGIVSNIPSVCDIDRISLNELLLPLVATVMAHELGHSLGSQHDGITNGFCQDEQQFVMTAFAGGEVPWENRGNPFRFSKCSAQYFQAALQGKTCLKRENFVGSPGPFPSGSPLIGQEFNLDQQCDGLFSPSRACREQVTLMPGSWSEVCRNAFCRFGASTGRCFTIIPLEFTSCGNRHWCRGGFCVESTVAPEKPVDCPAGDNPSVMCDINLCARTYDDVTRFIECCDTCRPIKTERFVTVQLKTI
ncbi:A disintegrin and metalloproteinase with thrombospondin motifs 1 [Elysia marginata]|uniref:A disintegrin and metalloproteinase with thrombospondin motifs 1 n=1 Tax=Elysia marginata TaxID=1093978 RepID=A0AAV4JNY6_9GAST|nr:A disintegrin and metalloproteinase with thrombospondin motifs 1 [Elysia marginata]